MAGCPCRRRGTAANRPRGPPRGRGSAPPRERSRDRARPGSLGTPRSSLASALSDDGRALPEERDRPDDQILPGTERECRDLEVSDEAVAAGDPDRTMG